MELLTTVIFQQPEAVLKKQDILCQVALDSIACFAKELIDKMSSQMMLSSLLWCVCSSAGLFVLFGTHYACL